MSNPNNIDNLLNMAGQRLGKSPEELRQQLAQNNLGGLGLSAQQQQQIQNILQNPAELNKILSNPQIAQLLKGFGQR